MTYHGIDLCDNCGEVLEDGRSLAGLCEVCELAMKAAKRVVER